MAGLTLDSYMTQLRLLAAWLTHSGKSGRVIEGASALDALIGEEDCRLLKGMARNILAQAYAQLEDFGSSEAWACKGAATFGDFFPQGRADMIHQVIQARLKTFEHTRLVALEESVIAYTESEIESDLRNDLVGPAVQKMELLVTQIFTPRNDIARREAWLDRMEQSARELAVTMPEDGDIRTAAVCQDRALALLSDAQTGRSTDPDHYKRCEAYFDEAVALYMKYHRLVEAASTRQMQALAAFSGFKRVPAAGTLQRCIELMSFAKEAFQAAENTKLIAVAARWHSFYVYQAWLRGWTPGSEALGALQEAEEAWADLRADMTVFATLEAVSRRQQSTSAKDVRDTYKMAFHVCQTEGRVEVLWNWVQRAKARSLSDQLGNGMLIPATVREEIMREPRLREMINQEEELTQRIATSEAALRLRLRGELHALYRRMEDERLLKAVIDLRNGTPVTHNQILSCGKDGTSSNTQLNIVFVDWVEIDNQIWTVVLRKDGGPHWSSCGLTATEVTAWKEQWLDAEAEQDAPLEEVFSDEYEDDYPLRGLDKLVAPLRGLTTEGDLVVFCPTGILHSIPLHALWISEHTPVILQHAVVYCASLTSFWQCCQRAAQAAVPKDLPWTTVSVYEPGSGRRFRQTEQDAVHQSVVDLAAKHPGAARAVTGAAATRELFAAALQTSALVHFHGHCSLDRAALADQSLELADGSLAARDVFDMKLRSPHITLVACDSASQGIAAGDEPLGLVTALLCAGAGSVVGTVWPTASRTGREFAAAFYAELEAQRLAGLTAGGPGGALNLAFAVRQAVLRLRDDKDTRHPYHWAAFVLHGSWFFGGSGDGATVQF